MKENKGRFEWQSWARFEAVDSDGQAYQFEAKPYLLKSKKVWHPNNGRCEYVGEVDGLKGTTDTLIARYTPCTITVKDCDLAISYGPDGLTAFGITAEYQDKEQPATVALFDFLRWCLDQNFIGGYCAEEPGEEVVTLPVPPELEDNRLSLRIMHVCDWLRTLPLSVIESACNGNLSMWQLLDAETGEPCTE